MLKPALQSAHTAVPAGNAAPDVRCTAHVRVPSPLIVMFVILTDSIGPPGWPIINVSPTAAFCHIGSDAFELLGSPRTMIVFCEALMDDASFVIWGAPPRMLPAKS